MKKIFLLFTVVMTLLSCSSDDNTSDSNELVGSWRLQKIVTFPGDVYNFNESELVVYHFNENMNLVVESNIELDDLLSPLVTSQTVPYSFYFDTIWFDAEVVQLGNNSNNVGSFYYSNDSNILTLSEYDGSLLTFIKIQ